MLSKLRKIRAQEYTVARLFLLLGLSVFSYIWFFGVNVLYLDEWAFATLFKEYQLHGLSIDQLLKPHNEHRILFPKLLYILTVKWSHMNSLFYIYINGFIICLVCYLLVVIAKKTYAFSYKNIPPILVIIPLFILNFRQWENLIWAFQIGFYLVLIAVILALFLLEKILDSSNKITSFFLFLGVIVCGVIATFSSAMGFLVWIAGAVQLGIAVFTKRNYSHLFYLLFFILIGVLSFKFYTAGLEAGMSEHITFLRSHPIRFTHFFFALISLMSIKWLSILALPLGILLFSTFIFSLYKCLANKRLYQNKFWISLAIFSLLFAVLTTLGRAPFTFEYTDRSRYTTFTALFVVATFMLSFDAYQYTRVSKLSRFYQIFFVLLMGLSIGLNGIGLVFGYMQKVKRDELRAVLIEDQSNVSIEMKRLDPWLTDTFLQEVNDVIPYIEEHKYNVYRNN
jgi:hypothetical protein